MTKSGVIGASPTRPLTPSVPKYLRDIARYSRAHRAPDRERVSGRGDVVNAHDSSPALDGQQSRRHAGRHSLIGRPAGDRPERRLARKPGEHGITELRYDRQPPQQFQVVLGLLA